MLSKEKTKKTNRKKSILSSKAYPYISSKKGVLGGSPIITGTRISVRTIAGYYQMGMNVDEILNTLNHLSPSQVHSALAYYFDHQNEIDKEIRENNEIYFSGKN